MNIKKFKEKVNYYIDMLERLGYEPKNELDQDHFMQEKEMIKSKRKYLNYCLWMLLQAKIFIKQKQTGKAERWVLWVQAIFHIYGLLTINQTRKFTGEWAK